MSYPVVAPLPEAIQVEVTSACNLRCAMCLVRYRPPVNKLAGAMPWELFERLLDELPELRTVTLQGLGEPLLSPYLLDMVRLAKERGIRVGFNSNATLLRSDIARTLVRLGLDWLHVSLDAATADAYEAIRDGARFGPVLENLAGLVAAKREAGSDLPWVRVVFVAMRRNIGELPDLVELLADIGVSELRVQNLSHDFADTDPAGEYQEIRRYSEAQALWTGADRARVQEVFARAGERAGVRGLRLRLPSIEAAPIGRSTGPGCSWPWDGAYITSDGVVQPCCMVMGNDRVALGRLAEQSFADIWNGPAYRSFREQLLGGPPPEVCRGCSLYQGTF